MMKIKKETRIFDIITIVLTLAIIGYTIYQDIKINNLGYKGRAVDAKPVLELIGKPEFYVEKLMIEGKDYIDYPIVDTMVIGIDIEIKQILKFKNIGNEKAEIIARLWTDTITGEDYIRETILDKKEFLKKSSQQLIDDFFIYKELLPGDTIIIEDRRKIGMDLVTKVFVNHFLIIYDNSFGNRYDTYLKTKYKLNQPLFEPFFNQGTGQFGVHVFKKTRWEFFDIEIAPNRTTKIYTKKEKRKLDNIFETATNSKYK